MNHPHLRRRRTRNFRIRFGYVVTVSRACAEGLPTRPQNGSEKITNIPKSLACRMQWGRAAAGMEGAFPLSAAKCRIFNGAAKPRVRKFGRKTISAIPSGANGNFGHTGPGLSWEVGWGGGGR
jgi:hypothetical protein